MESSFKRAFRPFNQQKIKFSKMNVQPFRIRTVSIDMPFGLCQSEVKTTNIHSKMKSYLFGIFTQSAKQRASIRKNNQCTKSIFIQADTHQTEWNINDNKNRKLFAFQNNAENYVPANK